MHENSMINNGKISLTREPLKIFIPTSLRESALLQKRRLFFFTALFNFFVPCVFKRPSLSLLFHSPENKSTGTPSHPSPSSHHPGTIFCVHLARMPLLVSRDGDSSFHSFSSIYENDQVKTGWAFCMSKAYCKYARPSLVSCLSPCCISTDSPQMACHCRHSHRYHCLCPHRLLLLPLLLSWRSPLTSQPSRHGLNIQPSSLHGLPARQQPQQRPATVRRASTFCAIRCRQSWETSTRGQSTGNA